MNAKKLSPKCTTNIKVILYKSKILANGEHPLMVRITQNRKRKYVSLEGLSCPAHLWDFEHNRPKKNNPNGQLIKAIITEKLAKYEKQVLTLTEEKKDFTPDTIIQGVEQNREKISLYDYFDEIIQRNVEMKRIGNSIVYKDTLSTLKKCFKRDFSLSEVDNGFLEKFERYQRINDISEVSMAVRFRTLRALLNTAIREKLANINSYPFKEFKISKFDTTTRKRAIDKSQMKKIEAQAFLEGSTIHETQLYFLFSYYGFGMNFTDMAKLKWKNIIGDRIFYKRSKTGKELHFKIIPKLREIIEYWKPLTGGNADNYVFPILRKEFHISPAQIKYRTHKVLKRVNRDLKVIGKMVGLETPLTTYVARHTTASVMKRNQESTSIIKDALGHSDERTTQIYLSSFENEVIDAAQDRL